VLATVPPLGGSPDAARLTASYRPKVTFGTLEEPWKRTPPAGRLLAPRPALALLAAGCAEHDGLTLI
jgi:hypothetical protein